MNPDKNPPACLDITRLGSVALSTVIKKATRRVTPRRPHGAYAGLRSRLLALDDDRAIAVPYDGDDRSAREMLSAVCKGLRRNHPELRFSIRKDKTTKTMFVSRQPAA